MTEPAVLVLAICLLTSLSEASDFDGLQSSLTEAASQCLDAATVRDLVKKLAEDKASYLRTVDQTHDVLAQALSSAAEEGSASPTAATELLGPDIATTARASYLDTLTQAHDVLAKAVSAAVIAPAAIPEAEKPYKEASLRGDSDAGEDELTSSQQTFRSQELLRSEFYTEDGLRGHINGFTWIEAGSYWTGSNYSSRNICFPVPMLDARIALICLIIFLLDITYPCGLALFST